MPYLTGSYGAATDYICRRVRIPNDLAIIEAVNGALTELTKPYNWEQEGSDTPDETAALMLLMYREYFGSDACMIGAVFPYATANPPDGCLPCDGAIYNRVDWPRLYAALDPVYQVSADQFQVPELNDRFVLGEGTRAINETGGLETVVLAVDELPEHDHTAQPHAHTDAGHSHTVHSHLPSLALVPDSPPISTPNPVPELTGTGFANIQPETVVINSTGGGQAHENMPPFTVLPFCIVAR